MALATPRSIVAPPAFAPRQFGLWSVVEDRSASVADERWRNGVRWQDHCGLGGTTYSDDCRDDDETAASKAANVGAPWYQADPFTVFAQVSCDGTSGDGGGLSPVGQVDLETRAAEALARVEAYQVERAFWTGAAGGDAGIVYPHLAADTAALSTAEVVTITLQCAATTVTGSTLLDPVEGIASLESALGACLAGGSGVIHVPLVLSAALSESSQFKADGGRLRTQAGNLVALGAGYPGTGPDGTAAPAGSTWVYATGPVFGYRSQVTQFSLRESLNRSENTALMIAERTTLLGFSCCCLYAALVSTGGVIAGAALAAS